MLARFCLLPVLLFAFLPLAARADESPKEKAKIEEAPITIPENETVVLKPGHGFSKKIKYQRG